MVVELGQGEAQARVYWYASMAYADRSTTNNYAENMGLLTG